MTNEEAHRILSNGLINAPSEHEWCTAFRMAIKKLEQIELNPSYNGVKFELEDWYDVPSDEMTLGQARQAVKDLRKKLMEYLEQQPCNVTDINVGDIISRQALLDELEEPMNWTDSEAEIQEQRDYESFVSLVKSIPSVTPKTLEQESKTEQFAKWVAREIFDDYWEYNKDAFAEIACRKLEKLGIVRAKGDEWELIEPQESEEV